MELAKSEALEGEPLTWPQSRVDRAAYHLAAVESRHREISTILQNVVVNGLIAEDRRSVTFSFEVPSLPVVDLACEVADCVHNLRASLDALVWSLLGEHEQLLTEAQRKVIRFPLAESEAAWLSFVGEVRRWISPMALSRIEKLQPWRLVKEPSTRSALAALHKLDIAQKHREGIRIGYRLTRVSVKDGTVDYDDGTDDVIEAGAGGASKVIRWEQLVEGGADLEPETPLVRMLCEYEIRSVKVSFEAEVEPLISIESVEGPLLHWLRSLLGETRYVHNYIAGDGPEPDATT